MSPRIPLGSVGCGEVHTCKHYVQVSYIRTPTHAHKYVRIYVHVHGYIPTYIHKDMYVCMICFDPHVTLHALMVQRCWVFFVTCNNCDTITLILLSMKYIHYEIHSFVCVSEPHWVNLLKSFNSFSPKMLLSPDL